MKKNTKKNTKDSPPIEISICFPAYNEERNIALTVTDAIAVMDKLNKSYEVLVVNDGSKDGTESILRDLEGKYPLVRLHHHLQNQGYAITTRTCLEQARGSLIFVIDSDRQHDLGDIPLFLEAMDKGCDLSVGWKKDRQDQFHRVWLAKGYNFLFRLFFGSSLHDVDCGFRCLTKEAAQKIKIGYEKVPVGPEIFARALQQKMKIAEVVVKHYPPTGKSTLNISPKKIITIFQGLYHLRKELSKEKQAHENLMVSEEKKN